MSEPHGTDDPRPPEPDGDPKGAAFELYKRRLEDHGLRLADAIAERAAARLHQRQQLDADLKAESDMLAAIHAGYVEVVKGSLDRAVDRGTFITTVVSAVATTYAALLGLVYGVSGSTPQPLPARGAAPFLFLGLSLVLASVYVAFLRHKSAAIRPLISGVGSQAVAEQRLSTFVGWVMSGVLVRAWALRLSVISLAVSVALLPLPFLKVTDGQALGIIIAAAAVVALWAAGEAAHAKYLSGHDMTGGLVVRDEDGNEV